MVAMQINRTVQRAIEKTPYEVVFGQDMRREERGPIAARAAMVILDENPDNMEEPEEVNEEEELAAQLLSELGEDVTQPEAGLPDSPCEDLIELVDSEDELPDTQVLVHRQRQREACQAEAQVNQRRAAATMVTRYSRRHDIQVFKIGDLVSIAIPRLDRGPLDNRRVLGRIKSVPREDRYEVETVHGVVQTLLPTTELLPVPPEIQFQLPTGLSKDVSLHYIAAQESATDIVQTSCNCKKLCKSRRCACHNAGLRCSIACHSDDYDCQNLSSVALRTEQGL